MHLCMPRLSIGHIHDTSRYNSNTLNFNTRYKTHTVPSTGDMHKRQTHHATIEKLRSQRIEMTWHRHGGIDSDITFRMKSDRFTFTVVFSSFPILTDLREVWHGHPGIGNRFRIVNKAHNWIVIDVLGYHILHACAFVACGRANYGAILCASAHLFPTPRFTAKRSEP